jgi:hypothetical protein
MTRITDAENELLPIHCGALRRRGEEITADLIEHVLLAEINDLTSEVERLKVVAEAARALDSFYDNWGISTSRERELIARQKRALAALESK